MESACLDGIADRASCARTDMGRYSEECVRKVFYLRWIPTELLIHSR